ncbi:hypothetical protein [Actinokineospora diospyrosa]|uniref:Uncharacterized protein n=1 Tax=Actinokineospora diospyrosa TaxID=103728 RepID=A0ABT1I586_9PSEU|nr:hypothetical protein [Actinokineospora diospyrosa]MCP2267792.1 hypothetical protein [Actinokineospora diospyrosa]
MSAQVWTPDPGATFHRRLGIAPTDPGSGRDPDTTGSGGEGGCPDIWELDNGDVAVIGRDLTAHYASQLPAGVSVGPGESLVIIPRGMARAAKRDIPDA